MTLAVVLGLAVLVALVVAAAVWFPQRVSTESHGVHTRGDTLDGEAESYRDHPPGGGTGGL